MIQSICFEDFSLYLMNIDRSEGRFQFVDSSPLLLPFFPPSFFLVFDRNPPLVSRFLLWFFVVFFLCFSVILLMACLINQLWRWEKHSRELVLTSIKSVDWYSSSSLAYFLILLAKRDCSSLSSVHRFWPMAILIIHSLSLLTFADWNFAFCFCSLHFISISFFVYSFTCRVARRNTIDTWIDFLSFSPFTFIVSSLALSTFCLKTISHEKFYCRAI